MTDGGGDQGCGAPLHAGRITSARGQDGRNELRDSIRFHRTPASGFVIGIASIDQSMSVTQLPQLQRPVYTHATISWSITQCVL